MIDIYWLYADWIRKLDAWVWSLFPAKEAVQRMKGCWSQIGVKHRFGWNMRRGGRSREMQQLFSLDDVMFTLGINRSEKIAGKEIDRNLGWKFRPANDDDHNQDLLLWSIFRSLLPSYNDVSWCLLCLFQHAHHNRHPCSSWQPSSNSRRWTRSF